MHLLGREEPIGSRVLLVVPPRLRGVDIHATSTEKNDLSDSGTTLTFTENIRDTGFSLYRIVALVSRLSVRCPRLREACRRLL